MSFFRRQKPKRHEIRSLDGPSLGDLFSPSVKAKPEKALALSAVYACVDRLSSTIGTLPVHLYQEAPSGKRLATSHPLYRLLKIAPNPFQSPADFAEYLMVCLLLRGNAYVHIRRNARGQVDRLLPLAPDRIKTKLAPSKAHLDYYLDNDETPLPYGSIWHLKGLSIDGLHGVSPIEYAATVIDAGQSAQKISKAILDNTARPSGVLEAPETLDEAEFQNLKTSWDAAYSGTGQGKVAILENGVKFTPITISLTDKQYIETRQLTREDIAGIYNVPLYMLNGAAPSGSTEDLATHFYTSAIRPWLVRIEQSFRKDVLLEVEQLDYFLRFSIDGIMRASLATRTAAYKTQLEIGMLSLDEARGLEDRPPRPGADLYFAPLNMAHIDASTGAVIYNGPQNPISTEKPTNE